MRRILGIGVALLALAGAGCTSVKMVQRDGCWVRRTEKSFGRVHEEVGPCDRGEPKWAQDRLTRLLQECMAQADWRWHARALEVWSRRLPYPTPQPREDELLRVCLDEARSGMVTEQDAAALKSRIGDLSGRISELSGERDALRGDAARDHAKLLERDDRLAEWLGKSHDKMSDWLGQAAQKPPGNATASATSSSTSDGTASTDSGTTLSADSGSSVPPSAAPVSSASVVLPPTTPVAAPSGPAVAPAAATADQHPDAARPAPKRTKRARRPLVRPAAAKACAPPAGDATPCTASAATPPAAPAAAATPAPVLP
jgi:hypothetical protein